MSLEGTERWSTFDHTGDLGLEVTAPTPERLHELAAVALLAQTVLVPPGEPAGAGDVEVVVELEGADPADLLVHWLNTALLEAELRRAVWTRARVTLPGPGRLRGKLAGPRFDRQRHEPLREVKAVSHHGLELHLEPPACSCRMVLDL